MIPTELNGTKAVSPSRSSQQASQPDQQGVQLDGTADQGMSFQSFLHNASHSGAARKSDDQEKTESKADRKKDGDATAKGWSEQHDSQVPLNAIVLPVPCEPVTPAASCVQLAQADGQFDLTKAMGTAEHVVPAGVSSVPTAGIAEAFHPKQISTQILPNGGMQFNQAAASGSDNGSAVDAAPVTGQDAQAAPVASQVPQTTGAAAQPTSTAGAPEHRVGGVEPKRIDVKSAPSVDAVANPVAGAAVTAPPLAVEAGMKFRFPKLQAMEPIPGASAASKLKNDRTASSAAMLGGSNTQGVSGTAGPKPKDPHDPVENGSDSKSGTGEQQGTPIAVNATSAAAHSGNSQADASTFQAAVAANAPRDAGANGGAHAAKAQDAQPAAASAPAATAVSQMQDLQAKVNTARLVQGIHDSEMRVGVRSGEFGDISIHTSMSRSAISAQISVEHGELAKMIAASLPELRSVLGSRDQLEVRVAMHEQVSPQMDMSGRGGEQGSQREARSGAMPVSYRGVDGIAAQETMPAATEMHAIRPTLAGRVDLRI